ncbi:hypothetical protein HELRODRAFT_163576 [Helobdella robusta]|uniref:RING-type E3 ubiquitin transferase n=1 Tax=Helobdella robusta TaxID=6412 RepID=T1EU85_HELRO|nr:hypothetical protein HELRODRAFT_163576 [Helobdella robusta]ESN96507.1 hypothetical protein HELRODRAFT_163576 [Helobdella robusta]
MEASFEPTSSYSRLKPDDCVICLSAIQPSKKAKIYGCLHAFCFDCIKEFARKIRPFCPTCDQEISYVLHNLRGDEQNDENNFSGDFYLVEFCHHSHCNFFNTAWSHMSRELGPRQTCNEQFLS